MVSLSKGGSAIARTIVRAIEAIVRSTKERLYLALKTITTTIPIP